MTGKDITIYGDGSQTRSFIYVSDQVEGIFRLLMSDYNQPVNIGNPVEISINQLAKEIIEITGSKSKLINQDLPKDDPKIRQPDITLAKKILNWEPKVSRADGLAMTYEYFKGVIK